MGDNETVPLDSAARREFLTGLFSTWFASEQGREKSNADDRKRGRIVAEQASDMFFYYADQRRRHTEAAAAQAA